MCSCCWCLLSTWLALTFYRSSLSLSFRLTRMPRSTSAWHLIWNSTASNHSFWAEYRVSEALFAQTPALKQTHLNNSTEMFWPLCDKTLFGSFMLFSIHHVGWTGGNSCGAFMNKCRLHTYLNGHRESTLLWRCKTKTLKMTKGAATHLSCCHVALDAFWS